ncbi:MAG: aminotransferase class IV [Bacteroidales bacterium]|jgi:4-amino-4-deoxychorismate lyase|nr:aminotransferase class IV [Bacteroidales bacterium]
MRFIESIRMTGGVPQNAGYHLRRVARSVTDHYSSTVAYRVAEDFLKLIQYIEKEYASDSITTRKLRVIYGSGIEEWTADEYVTKKISTLKFVHDDSITYRYKYADRSSIEKLFSQRGDCDDIIICRNGLVTDSSYSNIIVSDATGFYTPSSSLLEGCMRQQLLDEKRITVKQISVNDLNNYRYIYLVNALRGFMVEERIKIREGKTIV